MPKLFAVYLGGSAPKANTELHDVVFVTGDAIEDTYPQLLDRWLGSPSGLHIDSWIELDVIDGFKIGLTTEAIAQNLKLYFVNFGSYRRGKFMEFHLNRFLVGDNISEVKARAKRELAEKFDSPIHTDDLYDLDECLAVENINGFRISLEPTSQVREFLPNNSYHIIPKSIIEAYLNQHPDLKNSSNRPLNKIR